MAVSNETKRIIDEMFEGRPFARPPRHLQEAIANSGGLREGYELGEDIGWRRLGHATDQRELEGSSQEQLYDLITHYYRTMPLGHGIIDSFNDMVLGPGISFQAKGDAVQDLLDKFWNDPENDLENEQHTLMLERIAYGELLLPIFLGTSGTVRIGYIYPRNIARINYHPDDDRKIVSVVVQPPGGVEQKTYYLPQVDPKGLLKLPESQDDADGFAFYFRANNFMVGRGRPMLEPLMDWIQAYDQDLFNELRRRRFQGAFIWDIACEGLTEEQIEAKVLKLNQRPPRHGALLVHNEKETWNALGPPAGAGKEAGDVGLEVKRLLGIGTGLPDHLIGAAQDINRATASESNTPFHKRIQVLQKKWSACLEYMFRFVIDQNLPGAKDKSVEITFPDITTDDNKATAEAAFMMAQALTLAEQQQIMTRDQKVRLFYMALGEEPPDDYLADLDKQAKDEFNDDFDKAAEKAEEFIHRGNGGGQVRESDQAKSEVTA